jgi:TRAP-type mannitol/chloroaromatic compound transport system substrate-binding protein
MKRRQFLQTAAVGAAATAVAAPAIAQSMPEVKWRLQSGFPKSLDTIYGAAETIAKFVSEATDGKFQIQPFAAGEIVGTPQIADAVGGGTVELGHTCSYYYFGKDPTFAIGTALPFGLNARQQNAWLYHGGGNELYNAFLADYGVVGIPGGATGAQMGGWFRDDIRNLADLKGVKMRIAGIAGQVMSRLGVVPQQLPGGDIYPALERGTIDAAEWIGPYDDERLGFYQIAPNYYYPAYWEGGLTVHFFINKTQYETLPEAYKVALDTACKAANLNMQAMYDVKNTSAIRSLVGKGVKLRPMPRDIMDAAYKAAFELYAEYGEEHPAWAKIYPEWKKFRDESFQWFRVAEYSYDSYNYAAQAAGN